MNAATADQQDARDMERLAGGEDVVLNQLMERHAERLYRYLLRSLQDESDAADLSQETFARVYQSRASYNSRQKFTTWLYAIAGNLVRDRYRWRSRHPQVSLDAEDQPGSSALKHALSSAEVPPDQDLQCRERSAVVREAIAGLPRELREALILSVYEDLPHAEIAEIQNCTPKAVETRIYRARQQLRTSLAGMLAV